MIIYNTILLGIF